MRLMSANSVDVGSTSNKVFIAHPAKYADEVETPITKTKKHVLILSQDDVRWLIKALQYELEK